MLVSLPASATTYYVANDGSNSNNGLTEETPFLTVLHGIGQIYAGDTLLLKRGDVFRGTVFPTRLGTDVNPITVKDYGEGDLPLITGMIIIDSATFSQVGETNEWKSTGNAAVSKVLYVDGTKWTEKTAGSLTENSWDWVNADGGTLYIYGDPTGKVVEAGAYGHGFYIDAAEYWVFENLKVGYTNSTGFLPRGGANHITIKNCEIYDTYQQGIFLSGETDGSVVDNNTITYTGLQGVYIDGGDDIEVKNNTISQCKHSGIKINAGERNEIFNNHVSHSALTAGEMIVTRGVDTLIYNNTSCCNTEATQFAGEGIDSLTSTNTKIYNNLVYDTHSVGIYIDESTGTEVYNNVVINPLSWGISANNERDIEDVGNHLIYNNLIVGTVASSSSAMVVSDELKGYYMDNVKYYNNTVIGFQRCIGLAGSGHTNIEFKNNLCYDASSRIVSNPNNNPLTLNNNLYYTTSGSAVLAHIDGTDYPFTEQGFADFKTAFGQDSNSIILAPVFVDFDGEDYSQDETSPAVNAGINFSEFFTADIEGTERTGGWTIGAYQTNWRENIKALISNAILRNANF